MLRLIPAALAASILSSAGATAPRAQASLETKADAGAELKALFERSDAAKVARNPVLALGRADMVATGKIGDVGSERFFKAERAAAEADLAALKRIDRPGLNPDDQIAYDVFEYETRQTLKDLSDDILQLTAVRPINHFSGMHVAYAGMSSGRGAVAFKTVQDYDKTLERHADYVRLTRQWIDQFRQGLASGVVETKITIGRVIEQLNQQLEFKPEESPFYGPVLDFPDAVPEAERARLRAAYLNTVVKQINPAYLRLRDFLQNEYLPKARDGVGLIHMKGGAKLYEHLIEKVTTLPLKADEVHALGLAEVERIQTEMEAIRAQLGFAGKTAEFANHLRDNPALAAQSVDRLRERYEEAGKKVDLRIAEQFSAIPKSKLIVRPYDKFREIGAPGASYEPGSLDGARPGTFFFNASNLPTRRLTGAESLFLHEGSPGHHFQVSLARENAALPNFMRFGGNTAYLEGWALYAETLGDDLGLYSDPYQRYGHLQQELFRAHRLVVDTGLHAKGWTKEQAIEYMGARPAEIERYIAVPGQALGYKVGGLTIQRLRKKAEGALGDRFDPREFHAQVLMTGALPMRVLEAKIDRWIATARRQ